MKSIPGFPIDGAASPQLASGRLGEIFRAYLGASVIATNAAYA
jgi:hypothetical protein